MSSFFEVTFAAVDELCSPEMETLVYIIAHTAD